MGRSAVHAPASDLAKKLKGFGIGPKKVRIEGLTDPVRGYEREDFLLAWSSYLGVGTWNKDGTPLTSDVPSVPSVPSPQQEAAELLCLVVDDAPTESVVEQGDLVSILESRGWPKSRIGSLTVGPGPTSWQAFLGRTKIPEPDIVKALA